MCKCVFFFNDPATTEIYTYGHTLSLHDALPICKLLLRKTRTTHGQISRVMRRARTRATTAIRGAAMTVPKRATTPAAQRTCTGKVCAPSSVAGVGLATEERKSGVEGQRVSVRVEIGGTSTTKKKHHEH